MRSNLRALIGQKAQREQRNISVRKAASEAGVNPHTLYAMANGTLRQYPAETIERVCHYLDCEIGELLILSNPE